MNRAAPVEISSFRTPLTAIRDAPAIRRFAEPDQTLVHWSELDRTTKAHTDLLKRDVCTFFGRFG